MPGGNVADLLNPFPLAVVVNLMLHLPMMALDILDTLNKEAVARLCSSPPNPLTLVGARETPIRPPMPPILASIPNRIQVTLPRASLIWRTLKLKIIGCMVPPAP